MTGSNCFRACAATLITWCVLLSGPASAQDSPLPSGRMTLVVGFTPGGPLDLICRILADKLGPRFGRTIVLEHRPGTSGNIAAAAVAKSAPDGLTVLAALDTVFTINPWLLRSPGFKNEELSALSLAGQSEQLLGVPASIGVKSIADLVAYSKSNPVTFASGGTGSSGHLAFEYLRMVTGIKGSHVPYRGAAPAANDLLAGHVQAAFIATAALLPHVKSGKVTALAISSPKRHPFVPDVPTALEAGVKDFEAVFMFVTMVPSATPQPVQAYLSREIARVFELSDVREKISAVGLTPRGSTQAEARAWIEQEGARWRKVVAATGMKVE